MKVVWHLDLREVTGQNESYAKIFVNYEKRVDAVHFVYSFSSSVFFFCCSFLQSISLFRVVPVFLSPLLYLSTSPPPYLSTSLSLFRSLCSPSRCRAPNLCARATSRLRRTLSRRTRQPGRSARVKVRPWKISMYPSRRHDVSLNLVVRVWASGPHRASRSTTTAPPGKSTWVNSVSSDTPFPAPPFLADTALTTDKTPLFSSTISPRTRPSYLCALRDEEEKKNKKKLNHIKR